MKANPRRERILEMLAGKREVSVEIFVRELGVSVMTIRRDLAELSKKGKLSRTHGGAVLSKTGVVEFAFREQADLHITEKRAIAEVVAKMIEPGMAISLDTGSTTLEVARAIAGIPNLRVLTTSLAVASVLHTAENIDLILTGGTVRKTSPDLMGDLAEENLKRFRTNITVHGADAVTKDGVFAADVRVASISRAMVENAEKVVLVVDSSKFINTSFVKSLSLSELDVVVTDDGCSAETRSWLENEVEVIFVTGGSSCGGKIV
ncbi:MAG: DeoR/GlpR transcriptional regulator [Kiritimatiellae bacterium]|nr:DeoR/GlpR transcriptional regulator [Kiritimatiellia bacterium]